MCKIDQCVFYMDTLVLSLIQNNPEIYIKLNTDFG